MGGCDNKLFVLPLLVYRKLIKPKLIKCYGPIAETSVLRQEKRIRQITEFMSNFESGKLTQFLIERNINKKEATQTPFEKFFKSKNNSEYFGTSDYKFQSKTYDLLEEKSIYRYEDENPFFLYDNWLPYIDLFESMGMTMKVSNKDQVENFIKYIEAVKKAYGRESGKSSPGDYYFGCITAGKVFSKVLQEMKSVKRETVLILRSSS